MEENSSHLFCVQFYAVALYPHFMNLIQLKHNFRRLKKDKDKKKKQRHC